MTLTKLNKKRQRSRAAFSALVAFGAMVSVASASPLLPLNYPKAGLAPLGTVYPKCSENFPSFSANHRETRFLSCFLSKVVIPGAEHPNDGAAVSEIYRHMTDAALLKRLRQSPSSAMVDLPGFTPVRFEQVTYSPYHSKTTPMIVYGYLVFSNGTEEHSKFYALTFAKRQQFGHLVLKDISSSVIIAHPQ